MKAGGGKEWFTAAELAELGLPGLPTTKRKMNERASADMWAMRVGNDGQPLARASGRRGGGLEYHWSVVPAAARAALAARAIETLADVSPQPETRAAAKWRHFERLTAKAKAEAHRRATAIAMIENYVEIGRLTKSAAVANTAARMKVGAATLWNWLKLVEGVAAADRLAYLAPGHAGGGAEAEIDPSALKLLMSDYLRPEQPTFSSCYYRLLKGYAEPNGITLPCERTLRRRLDKQLDRRVVTARREGAEALRRSLPSQRRSVEALQAMELVNIDGHKWDVFVEWPDGKIERPLMVAIQDVYSRKMLAWSIGRTESAVETRLAFAQLFANYGIPAACLMDNGRAFASKWITGGATSRFRFKIREEEPLGILTALGIKIHWATPYRGQSKPIERAFRDLCDSVARHPALAGAYTGNGVDKKPENYGSKAIPIDRFREIVADGIAAHNARANRRTEMGAGAHSFDQVFAASYAVAPIGRATPEQLRLALLAADDRPTDKRTGVITLHGNQYWAEELSQVAGDRVTIRFNPDDLHAPVHVYTRDGRYLCAAPAFQSSGFSDVEAAKVRARIEKRHKSAVRELIDAEQLLSAAQVADMLQRTATDPLDAPTVVRPVRHRGQTAAALKPLIQAVPIAREEAAQDARIDRMAGGMRRLRPVE